MTGKRRQEKDMQRAIAAEKRLSDAQNRCWYCFKGQAIRKHLIISLGDHAMLMLPPGQGPKMPGHCVIVPQDVRSTNDVCVCQQGSSPHRVSHVPCCQHVPSLTAANENVYDEVNKFKAALDRMFTAKGQSVIFLETSMQFHRRPHCVIECVPLTQEAGMDAPIYYKKVPTSHSFKGGDNERCRS